MNAGGRLALYGAGLAVAFGVAFGLAGAIVPDSYVAAWAEKSAMNALDQGQPSEVHGGAAHGGAEHDGTEHDDTGQAATDPVDGLSLDVKGFSLSPITAPVTVRTEGMLSFQILDAAGDPVTGFATAHEKDLHLIVVRSDGAQFRHVHPVLDAAGTWSIPWSWDVAGTYRVYADFTSAGTSGITLTRTVQVAGTFTPVDSVSRSTDVVDGYTVSVDGHLVVGSSSELTVSISRDGVPVTTLEPYLGVFGHLVVLREGDLAYLHAHAAGDVPKLGDIAGPEISFSARAPTAGRYLLYLDFQIDGVVHTAEFVLDTSH